MPATRPKLLPKCFVVSCKQCLRHVPIGSEVFPRFALLLACPLCGERRQYVPTEVRSAVPDRMAMRSRVRMAGPALVEQKSA